MQAWNFVPRYWEDYVRTSLVQLLEYFNLCTVSLSHVPTTVQSYAHTLAMASTIFSTVRLISHIMRKIKLSARWRPVWWVFYLRVTFKSHSNDDENSALQLNQFAVICRSSWFDFDECVIPQMINLGHNWGDVHWPDNWTATTVDGKRSAQFEDTLLYVPILTKNLLPNSLLSGLRRSG